MNEILKSLNVNGAVLVLEEDCPECGPENDLGICPAECELCHGLCTITHHYTPEQYKEITGEEWPEDGPVWYRYKEGHWELGVSNNRSGGVPIEFDIVIATSIGKPPADYRPEPR